MNRWYDRDRKLSCLLDSFKTMGEESRDRLCSGIIGLIHKFQAPLIDEDAMKFPLEFPSRRWYDKDPYLWLIFNGLRRANNTLIKKVTDYLDKNVEESTLSTS